MEAAFSPPLGLTVTAAALAALLVAILPTCLYLYVEPRGRQAVGGSRATRRPRARHPRSFASPHG